MQAHQVIAGPANLELLYIVDEAGAGEGLRIKGVLPAVRARGAEGAARTVEVTEVQTIHPALAEHHVHAIDVRIGVGVAAEVHDVSRLRGAGFAREPVPVRAGSVALEEGRLVQVADGVERAEQGE